MAKYYNNKIKTGRVAGSVFAVRFGEVIERAYNPIVNNPKSEGQVESRAKLKLLSQLSAVMAPYIAMKREGAVSSRNVFTRVNYGAATYENNAADITLGDVKLTSSVVSLPGLSVTRDEDAMSVALSGGAVGLSRVVYVGFVRENDGTLRVLSSVVVSVPGVGNTFPGTLFNSPLPARGVYVYAYGVRDNTETARVKFGDMTILSAEAVAQLIVNTTLTEKDITLTETKFFELAPAQ